MTADLDIDPLTVFDLDLEQDLICDSNDCDNVGEWWRKHENCTRVNCTDCKEFVQGQLSEADVDHDFWCPVCKMSAPVEYWVDQMKWIAI